MTKSRLEAFSDGVIAIIITIMVLEIHVPSGHQLSDLRGVLPVLFGYLLSFVFVGIYWNNHHHMLQAVRHVNGPILWANLHLLFWLSLVPFATSWMGHSGIEPGPVAFYGLVLLMSGVAYFILARALIARHGNDSLLARALGSDVKGIVSLVCYTIAIGTAFVMPMASVALFVAVAILWLVPDRRIERHLETAGPAPERD
ncbi:MAG: DUF1211 domain-containing protein [Candidatus Eisenbacteria bacterium]|nr:DUF1211 domain-containing protein [Candidatus Eisenbacteria bacterium]